MTSVNHHGPLSHWTSKLRSRYFQEPLQSHPPEFSIITDGFFSAFYGKEQSGDLSSTKQWFHRYITQKFEQIWPLVAAVVNGIALNSTGPQVGDELIITYLLLSIAEGLTQSNTALFAIVKTLHSRRLVLGTGEDATQLTLAVIGWLSCIYESRFNVGQQILEIHVPHNELFKRMSQIKAEENLLGSRWANWKSLVLADEPLSAIWIVGNHGLSHGPSRLPRRLRRRTFKGSLIYAGEFIEKSVVCHHNLTEICGIQIEWADAISSHLEFDPVTKKLSVFRFPSYCVLVSTSSEGALFKRLARELFSPENTENTAQDFYEEVLLSYRLLFGPTKSSWKAARHALSIIARSGELMDPLLLEICEGRWTSNEIHQYSETRTKNSHQSGLYFLSADFPILGHRLLQLQSYVERHQPMSMLSMWHDRRDRFQWYTLWGVVLVGGLGIVFSLFQTIITALQIYQGLPSSPPPSSPRQHLPTIPLLRTLKRCLNIFGIGGSNSTGGKISISFVVAVSLDLICLTLVAVVAYPEFFRAQTNNSSRSRPQDGKMRIEWNCICGELIQDDYVELVPGAAETLQVALQNETAITQAHNENRDLECQTDRDSDRKHRWGFKFLTRWISRFSKGFLSNKDEEKDRSPPEKRTRDTSSPSDEALFLPVCIEKPNGSTILIQINVAGITSDSYLFACLRQHYLSIRGRWVPYLKFHRLECINFVQFELWPSDEVDVQPFYDQRAVPPPSMADEYEFAAAPVIPPISSSRLMHLWKSPGHPDGSGQTCLDRFPKRRRERLYVSLGERPAIGWGIHLVEGLDWVLIWMLIFIVVLIGSFVFGIMYSVLDHDIQSAFAISSYVISFFTLGIGACSICGRRIVDRNYS